MEHSRISHAAVVPENTGSVALPKGDKAVNSLPLLRTVAPVVEIRDSNDFPVEGATVVFTLPASGPGVTFLGGAASVTIRFDARGQAAAPVIVPSWWVSSKSKCRPLSVHEQAKQ
jgi:hypothetical protein